MFQRGRQEYLVRTCPSDDTEGLENLLNSISLAGWELYMLHEAENEDGELQYNCIFQRQAREERDIEENEIISVSNFKTRMEKSVLPSNDAYRLCKDIQSLIIEKQNEVDKIKKRLDSSSITDNEREDLNEQISLRLDDVEELKAALNQIIGPETAYDRLNQEKITLVVSEELTELVDINKNGELISETVKLRQDMADKIGYIVPTIKFTNLEAIDANEFRVDIRGIKAYSGFVYPGYIRLYEGQANLTRKPKNAIEDVDPITGKRVFWIEQSRTKSFWDKGKTATEVIIEALEYVFIKHVDIILDFGDTNKYIEIAGNENLYLVENLLTDLINISDLRNIFSSLLRENVSIKDIIYIFEKLNDVVNETTDNEEILEKLRISLKRQICNNIADENGTIFAISLKQDCEDKLYNLLNEELEEISPNKTVKSSRLSKVIKSIIDEIKDYNGEINSFALITPIKIRKKMFLLLDELIPGIRVLAYEEMDKNFNFEIISDVNC